MYRHYQQESERGRSWLDRIRGRNKIDPIDLIHEEANWDEWQRQLELERIEKAWTRYEENKKAVEEGRFIVKKGSLIFRVVAGIRMGGPEVPEVGTTLEEVYATPHPACIRHIIEYNDQHQSYHDGSQFDHSQQVAVIKVESFHIPEPDISYDPATDLDEVVASGVVLKILNPEDFFARYGTDDAADFKS